MANKAAQIEEVAAMSGMTDRRCVDEGSLTTPWEGRPYAQRMSG
jgi:3-dehydroquinate synthase class II